MAPCSCMRCLHAWCIKAIASLESLGDSSLQNKLSGCFPLAIRALPSPQGHSLCLQSRYHKRSKSFKRGELCNWVSIIKLSCDTNNQAPWNTGWDFELGKESRAQGRGGTPDCSLQLWVKQGSSQKQPMVVFISAVFHGSLDINALPECHCHQ